MQAKASAYSISEAARILGLSADWLREGERRGRLPRAPRDRNGYRYYTPGDIEFLRYMGAGSRPRRLKSAEEVLEAAR
jgi:DNA-binding transcriptional MerR regulator